METAHEKKTTAKPLTSASLSRAWGHAAKRAFDVLASALGLLLLSPVFALLAFFIKRESPGPVFYRGPRSGKDGKPFGILKFRTMYECAASYQGPCVTAQDDARITPLGHWLRDTKLNELPQLWNVLAGEMSLVGPRPEDPHIAKTWPRGAYGEVLSVRPGITSPASVIYRDEEQLLEAEHVMDGYLKNILPDKLRLDQLYVRSHCFLSDLDIIVWTLLAMLPRLRRYTIPTESLYTGGLLYRFMNRYFAWFVVDSLVAFMAIGLAGLLWRLEGPLDLGMNHALLLTVSMAMIFSLVNAWRGLGRVWWHSARITYIIDLALASGISTLLAALLDWFVPSRQLVPLGMVFVSGLLAFLGFVAIRYRERLLWGLGNRWLRGRQNRSPIGERLLIVGAGECALLAGWLFRRSQLVSAFSIIGMVDDDPAKTGMTIDGYPVVGHTHRIPEIVRQQDVGVILFAIESISPDEQARILGLCRQTPARVIIIPDLLAGLREQLTQPVTQVALA
jgi:lipopolysaccharide/colanic/teichoic acid biosynthesis glycosyltransferase